MLSYADRAKSRPRNYPADPQPSTTSTESPASTNSTAPSSVAGVAQNEEKLLDASANTPQTQSTSTLVPVSSSSATQVNGDIAHEKTAPPVPSPAKVNVWAQRAQARALGGSANAKIAGTSQPGTSNTSSGETASVAPQTQTANAKAMANGARIGGIAVNEQEWPEVGPSTGSVSRPTIQTRSQGKDAELGNAPSKKEKPKWVPIAPAELRETADQLRSTSKGSSRGSNRSRGQQQASQSELKSSSVRNSPNRLTAQLSPANALDRSARQSRHGSRSHSQVASSQNSPLRRPGNLIDSTKVNGITDAIQNLVLQEGNTQIHQPLKSSRQPSPASRHALAPAPAPLHPLPPPPQQQNVQYTPSQGSYPFGYYPSSFPGSQAPIYAPHYPGYPYPSHAPPPSNFPFTPSSHLPPHGFPPGPTTPPRMNAMQFPQQRDFSLSASDQIPLVRKSGSISPLSIHSLAPPPPPPPVDLLSRPSLPQNSAPVTVNTSTIGNDVPRRPDQGHFKFGSVSSNRSAPSPVGTVDASTSLVPLSTSAPQLTGVTLGNGKAFSIGLNNSSNAIDLTTDNTDIKLNAVTNDPSSAKWVFGSLIGRPDSTAAPPPLAPPAAISQLPSPSTLDLSSEPNIESSGLLGGFPPAAESSPAGGQMQTSSSPSWDPIPRGNPIQSPSGVSDFEVRNYGYNTPFPNDTLPRLEIYNPNTGAPPSLPPPPPLPPPSGAEFEPQYGSGYYYLPFSPPHSHSSGPRPPYVGHDHGRWRGDGPYGGHAEYDSGFIRDRPPRGRGRRGRGMNGRGFGRGMRGGGDRSREFHQYPYRQDGPRPSNYRSPERHNPMSALPPDQMPIQDSYGYYGYPPAPSYNYVNPSYQPAPLPVSNPGFTVDPTRMHLLGQVEYYFSVQNLAGDTHLRRQMSSEGWVPIQTIAAFNRVRTLTGGVSLDYTVVLVKEVLTLSNLVEVDAEHDRVRLTEGRWRDFVLPTQDATEPGAKLTVSRALSEDQAESQGDAEDTDDDIEFVMGRSVGSPAKQEQPMPAFVGQS